MPAPLTFKLTPSSTEAPMHVDVEPNGEIILHGSFTSAYDGSTIDAATTTWPAEVPGGSSVDAGGLVDFEGGGLYMKSRDPVTHEVHAIATGEHGAVCDALHVASPCLPLRLHAQARTRLITAKEWEQSFKGGITVEVPVPAAYAPPPAAVPYLEVAAGIGAAVAIGVVALRYRKKRAESPAGRLLALGKRVRDKLGAADAVVAAPLAPAVETALRALRARRIDASSAEGKRVASVLARVETRLDESVRQAQAEEEQQAADELVREVESALEAADEATLASKG